MRRLVVSVVVLFAAIAPSIEATHAGAAATAVAPTVPTLHIAPVLTGLDHAWDVAFAPDGAMFATERPGRIWVVPPDGTARQLAADFSDLWVAVETGLMSVEVDPQYATNRRIYTCQGTTDGDDVKVVAWHVDAAYTSITRTNDPLVGGIDGEAGRHGGCQLRVDPAGNLVVGTGDAALGTNPENPFSLAGKTLRADRFSGAGVPGNPFFGSPSAGDPRIQTIGHRNLQGLAVQPGTGAIYSVEHGPDRDDEINLLVNGANYGWDPVQAGNPAGYNESVPMTDFQKFPNAMGAAWSSGIPTLATSGATFLQGPDWGAWQGALAVSTLKGSALHIFSVNGNSATEIAVPAALNGTFGRLRGAELGPDNILYVTTDNGNGTDSVIAVSPRIDKEGVGAASSATGRVDQVARGFDNAIWNRHFAGTWTPWTSRGGIGTTDPALSSWGPGRVDAFVRGTDGAVWHAGATNDSWSSWQTLGGLATSAPAAASWTVNRIDLFVRGTDGALWANAWNGSTWVGWYSLGGQLTSAPAVASSGVNHLDVFARGTDLALWHRAWTGSMWTPWESLGGVFTSGSGAVSMSSGRVDVFGRGRDGALWANALVGGKWFGWYGLGGALASDPDVESRSTGTLDVFARGIDASLWQRSWTGTNWTNWTPTPST
jgi:glucose/arabinose dehydrogenase